MSTWQKFYRSWGAFLVLLVGASTFMFIAPLYIPYAAVVSIHLLIGLWAYGTFLVRCPHCQVRLFQTIYVHGLPEQYCSQCGYDLMARSDQ
jgi:hypothetical protein